MKQLLETALEVTLKGEMVALATIVSAQGSTPRATGAKMLIFRDGTIRGTVGGGEMEGRVIQEALSVLKAGQPRMMHFTYRETEEGGVGICGGENDVFIDVLISAKELRAVLEAARNGETVAMATIVRMQGPTKCEVGAKMLVFHDGTIQSTGGFGGMEGRILEEALAALKTGQPSLVHYAYGETGEGGVEISSGEIDTFIDVLGPAKELLIIGAGHVGQAVAELGAFLGMDCIVMDYRPEFANQQRFPRASQILVDDIVRSLHQYPITRQTYIVIVTRGHLQDTEALGAVIRSPAAFIGMIGSRRKTGRVFETMRTRGVEQALLDRIHAPIGLEIGAETPEEIAVSIVGQIIAVMHGKAKS